MATDDITTKPTRQPRSAQHDHLVPLEYRTDLDERLCASPCTDLKALHGELDEAVVAAYGWPKAVARDGDEIVQRLLIINREIAAGTREYNPFDEELIFIPPPRVEVARVTPENQPHHSKPPV